MSDVGRGGRSRWKEQSPIKSKGAGMPIKKSWRVAVAMGSTIAMLATAGPAFGAAETPPPVPPLDEATCAHQPLTQALLPFGDTNLYTLAPGGAFSNALDWQLAGGATITPTTQPDGSAGGVLEPARASRRRRAR